ncbi:tripartite tricarboxylate transporter permease (plasmid) [Fusobacterium sp. SB021]|uniref:tripartite tricarboxylate transporter permease n=1 Tax=Fusobacterium sp. SB021 TaxID=2744227 RepID=UPI003CF1D052
MDVILSGILSVAANPLTIIFIFVGVAAGIIFGAIPGLTATMAITMFLPVTYTMSPIDGISTLVALYIGGISGGLISAILLNIPGTPSSVATCFDGRPLAIKGQAGKALGVGIVFSFIGTIFSIIALIIISPLLAKVAIKFGPYEYCALAVFSLSLVITLTGKDLIKGLMSAAIGAMIATVGLAPIDSVKRFTFGNVQLNAGFQLLVLLIGLFAISEVISTAESVNREEEFTIEQNVKIKGFGFSLSEFFSQIRNAIRSSIIGLVVGILPGIGGGISCMLSYTAAKNASKTPDKFGTGVIDGVVASETANNAGIGGAMIPLLTLGIPGDAATAMLLGGLMVHSVSPGPLIFDKNGVIVYGIFMAMIIASIAMLILELFGIKLFMNVLKVPKNYLLPLIVTLCVVGAFGNTNRPFDVVCVLIFGLVGFLLSKAKIPQIPLIMGFILGPIFELNLRRAAQLYVSEPGSLFQHPIALVFGAIAVLVIVFSLKKQVKA